MLKKCLFCFGLLFSFAAQAGEFEIGTFDHRPARVSVPSRFLPVEKWETGALVHSIDNLSAVYLIGIPNMTGDALQKLITIYGNRLEWNDGDLKQAHLHSGGSPRSVAVLYVDKASIIGEHSYKRNIGDILTMHGCGEVSFGTNFFKGLKEIFYTFANEGSSAHQYPARECTSLFAEISSEENKKTSNIDNQEEPHLVVKKNIRGH